MNEEKLLRNFQVMMILSASLIVVNSLVVKDGILI